MPGGGGEMFGVLIEEAETGGKVVVTGPKGRDQIGARHCVVLMVKVSSVNMFFMNADKEQRISELGKGTII